MGKNVADPGTGGRKRGLWPVLQVHGTTRPAIQVRGVVPDALDGLYNQGLPQQGGP